MRRLLFILSFVICPLSFSFAQQSGYQLAGPYAVVARNGQYASSKDGSERDMWQAWQRARQGDMSTAITIINAYTGTLQRFDGHDAPLCTIQAYWLLRAMMLASVYQTPEWAAMVRRAILPVLEKFEADSPYANGNWGHIVNRCRMAAAIFLGDKALYQHSIDTYLYASDNGSLPRYISETGQCQETGATASTRKYWDIAADGTVQTAAATTPTTFPFQLIPMGNAVGIKSLKNEITNSKFIYDLSGRKVTDSSLLRGMYIIKGKKVIVK